MPTHNARRKILLLPVLLAASLRAGPSQAQLLGTLLPPAIPGYGQKFSVTAQHRQFAPGATGWNFGTLSVAPSLNLAGGYDSAPGGSASSPVLQAKPSLLLADPAAGFGLYGQAGISSYPANHAQDTQTALLGAGERIELPREAITLSAAYLHGAATGFAFDTAEITAPIPFNMQAFRASDSIASGLFTLTPEFSFNRYVFSGASATANRTQPQGMVTLAYVPGGPLTALLRAATTQLDYDIPSQNAGIYEILGGLQERQSGLWTITLLAGAASRQPRTGPSLTTPVLEARADWMPTMLDKISLTASREINDPDAISAAPYTRTSLNLALHHDFPENFTVKLMADMANAQYIYTDLHEFLATGEISAQWALTPDLGVEAVYCYNTRQANMLSAANEHVVTLGLTWKP